MCSVLPGVGIVSFHSLECSVPGWPASGCAAQHSEYWGPLCRAPWSHRLLSGLSSESSHLGFLRLPFMSVSIQGCWIALPRCPLPAWKPEGWGNLRAHFICFTFLRCHCLISWEPLLYFSLLLVVSGERLNLVCYFLGWKHKSLKKFFNLIFIFMHLPKWCLFLMEYVFFWLGH